MKENKFKDVKGLEDVQYSSQLDTFEAKKTLAGFHNRWLYDLSINNVGKYGVSSNFPSADLFDNLKIGASYFPNLTAENGQYGESTVPNLRAISENMQTDPNIDPIPFINFPTTKKIDNKTDVFVYEENTMFYIEPRATFFTTRSGYFEITLKTNKQNCFVAIGAGEGTSSFVKRFYTGASINDPSYIDSDYMYISEINSQLSDLIFNIKDGKPQLIYRDLYNNDKEEIVFNGNNNIADGEWHHIIVNIGKPGTIREHGYKYNKRFIEIWVDGQLDFRTTEHINDKQLFFPFINYLLIDPYIAKQIPGVEDNGWETFDDAWSATNNTNAQQNVGLNEFELNILKGVWNPEASITAFNGAIDTFAMGANVCLSKFQIKQRYRLWKGFEKTAVKSFVASSKIIQPQINTNSKKALKLFWNNLINENCKNGVELDNNFQVDSYSITHKILNSLTEVNNIDLSNTKQLKFLKDVKVALKDNIVLWGPGKDFVMNNSHTADVTFSTARQFDGKNLFGYDELHEIYRQSDPGRINPSFEDFWTGRYIINLPISGLNLNDGDRILLTNQFNKTDNGIYVFNGMGNLITRADDALSPNMINNAIVRITDGYYKDTSWCLSNNIESFLDNQNWIELEYHPNEDNFNSQPLFGSRWTNQNGTERFIDLEQDINISKYDVITFMNYPDTNEEIKQHFIGYDDFEINVRYKNFIKSLQNVVANGASLFISSPKLATDMGIVKKFTLINQETEESDLQSASISPFEINEPSTQYFDTHRNNKYHLTQEIAGLTNKETYLLVDFINYVPKDVNSYEQYHAKYSYRQLGLKEGNEFFIPSLTLRKITENDKLPGFNGNRKGLKPMYVIDTPDINVGTTVTKFSNTYYNNNSLQNNPYDDFISTLIVHNGQLLNGQPINGKIFINCVEDSYTMSRKEYNKAVIQQVTQNDTGENTSTAQWQYSSTRLNRLPRKINIRELTQFGQTTSTNGGGGPLIQAPSNSSNGVIRSKTDKDNINYQSDLYTTLEEERYAIQEIPVLSMTWLGLLWLAD